MKKLSALAFCILLFSTLSAESHIAETLDNVDLLIEDKFSEKGHNFGEDYYVHNRNDYPVRFTIKINDAINAQNNLIKNIIVIPPNNKAPLGSVRQDDLTKESNWSYEWEVTPDR